MRLPNVSVPNDKKLERMRAIHDLLYALNRKVLSLAVRHEKLLHKNVENRRKCVQNYIVFELFLLHLNPQF